jgi:hypothetical protein
MDDGWIDRARRALVALAVGDAWGYHRGGPAAVEATALAALGLLATDGDGGRRSLAVRAGDRLASLQRPDGSLGVTADLPTPGWATPFASILWQALGAHHPARRRAADWLLGERVDTPPRPADPRPIAGHDTSIPGWPWVEGTHSWIEPTALALLALAREGRAGHPRAVDGVRLLRDRAIATGGWNYGNTAVFGRSLRPQPAPTGLALLALARSGEDRAIVEPALAYLRQALPTIRAPASLAWGLLGLLAWDSAPSDRAGWLAEAAAGAIPRDDAAPRLGLLLLASSDSALSYFLPPAEV